MFKDTTDTRRERSEMRRGMADAVNKNSRFERAEIAALWARDIVNHYNDNNFCVPTHAAAITITGDFPDVHLPLAGYTKSGCRVYRNNAYSGKRRVLSQDAPDRFAYRRHTEFALILED